MKKVLVVIASLILFSILLSGCMQQEDGTGGQSEAQGNSQQQENLTEDDLWMKKAIEEKNSSFCDNIEEQSKREECMYNMIPILGAN